MFSAWQRLSRDQRRTWSIISGAIVVGSVFKVAYFSLSRRIIVDDAHKKHVQAMGHLREAKEFAEWSQQDRERRLPKLSPEQAQQVREYLQIVHEHGVHATMLSQQGKGRTMSSAAMASPRELSSSSSSGAANEDPNCVGCPILNRTVRAVAVAASPAEGNARSS